MHGQLDKAKSAFLDDRALCCVRDDRGKGRKVSRCQAFAYPARIGTTCPTFDPNRDEYVPVELLSKAATSRLCKRIASLPSPDRGVLAR